MGRNAVYPLWVPRFGLVAILFAFTQVFAWGAVDYNRDVRPILSDACYHCHGPDEGTRKAKLRLDTKDGLLRAKDPIVVKGKSSQSELVKRIFTNDEDDQMPPPDSHRSLTEGQKQLLKKWIDEGARWDDHWAFVLPKAPRLPFGSGAPIDRLVNAKLRAAKLKLSPPATRERLLRRVTLDLTGVPPTPEELDAFLKDTSRNALEKAVDRLLASPRFGERMATDWLDIARYADTHGYQMDRYRAMWPYRDWVIKAFNENLPFDQFVTWQLAGDLLPSPTLEQRLATAFNRLHLQNEEGGIVEEEYRVAYVVDRVNTFGTAFLGLTLECSRCHDHKYDPISMEDYYSLFAFFQNIDESGQTTYFTDAMPVPTLLLADDAAQARIKALENKVKEKENLQQFLTKQARPSFEEWLKTDQQVLLFGLVGEFSFDGTNGLINRVKKDNLAKKIEDPQKTAGYKEDGYALNGENGFSFPGIGHFTAADPFTLSLWIKADQLEERAVIIHHSKAPIDAASRGYEVLLEKGHVTFGLHHTWPANSAKIRTAAAIPTNQWINVTAIHDGSGRAAGMKIFLNGDLAKSEVIRDGLFKDITYEGGEPDLAIGQRFRDAGFKGGYIDEFKIFNRALTPLEVKHLAGGDLLTKALAAKNPEDALLLEYFTANHFGPARKFIEDLTRSRKELVRTRTAIPEAMVMQELEKPKPAFILKRGAYDALGEPVTADTPKSLLPFNPAYPKNRLGLAKWLTDPGNPLMARVTVNRYWQMLFGKGLVETADNFGSQGAQPSNPELLDYLAVKFVKNDWNTKAMLKEIVLSKTYQQSSKGSPESLARDPENKLLSRGPVKRLTAEMLRDQALAASGLLVEKIGGPSVKPYQPEGLWEEIAMGKPKYVRSQGDDLYRRSVYTYWKRTVPHPAMITFDAAERNVCIVTRQSTSTPLQALALMNDTTIVEAARILGEKTLQQGGESVEEQAAWAFRRVTSRKPSSRELHILKRLFDDQRESVTAQEAAELLLVGDKLSNPALDNRDLAAATAVALAIFNHDEAVYAR